MPNSTNPIELLLGKPIDKMTDDEIERNIMAIQGARAQPVKLKEAIESMTEEGEPKMKFVKPKKATKAQQLSMDLMKGL